MLAFLILCLAAACTAVPSDNGQSESKFYYPPHPETYNVIKNLPQSKGALPAGFKYIFVDTNGQSSYNRGPVGTQIEIAGSPQSSPDALVVAATVIAKMTQYMPDNLFTQLATYGSVGIFTAAEKLIVYPEFYNLANGNCGTSCADACAHTCTPDGRKYEDIAGVGAARCVVLQDNLLCTAADPYYHQQSILAHEFTHTVHQFGVPDSVKQQVTAAYQNARAKSLWAMNSYAMTNEFEYLAEGASAFFYVNEDNSGSGGMVFCGGSLCKSEYDTRYHMWQQDINLYGILSYVYCNSNPALYSDLTICPTTVVG